MASVTVKVIIPKKFDTPAVWKEIAAGLKEVEEGALKDFNDTIDSWDNRFDFEHGTQMGTSQGRAFVETDNEIYGYVNNGTKEHDIPKSGTAFMRFQWGGKGSYRPKTKPGRFKSTPGGPSGPEVTALKVHHPGTDPRKFDELIGKRWLSLFRRRMEYALQDAAKKSGHGIP